MLRKDFIMNKFKKLLNEVIYISRVTKVTKKKIRLLFSVLLSNITVFFDILIILVFAFLLGGYIRTKTGPEVAFFGLKLS